MDVSGQLQAPDTLTLGKKLGVRWVGGWLGSMAGLDRDTNPRPIIPLQVSIPVLKVYI